MWESHRANSSAMILDGDLAGARRGDRWYVARPLVVLECPNIVDNFGWLTISVHYSSFGGGTSRSGYALAKR
jgi:hypothetical protein